MIFFVSLSDKDFLDNAGDRIPLGLLSIASQFDEKDVRFYDLNHFKQEDLIIAIEEMQPEAVAISVYTSGHYTQAIELSNKIRQISNTRLIAGGYHATFMPESLTEYFNTVIQGYGENSIKTALHVDGIINESVDLDEIKNINWDLINLDDYGIEMDGKRTATIITSRGCPYSCAFCGNFNRKVMYERMDYVLDNLSVLKDRGFEAVYFLDDVFTLDYERMAYILYNVGMPYRVTTRANLLDERKMRLLKDTGCEWLSIGIESGSQEILDKSNKGEKIEQIQMAIISAKKNGIKVKGFFIIGLPGETEETARQTIDFSLKLKEQGLTSADFYALMPFPGTTIWENPEKYGIEILDRDYTKYLQVGKYKTKVYHRTKELSSERIEQLIEEARRLWK
jgi:radical SAM superfamily enzyme YgiQ (UPF0313 family)